MKRNTTTKHWIMLLCALRASGGQLRRAEGAETTKNNSPDHVAYHVSVSGNDANDGSEASPFKTISKASEQAQPGDTITVHEGVYRERINPPRGGTSDEKRIVYQAAPGAKVVIKGSEQITGWTPVEKDVWKVTLPNSFFGDFNPYSDLLHGDWYEAKRPFHTGAVYLNGHWLKEAARKNLILESEPSGTAEDIRPELLNIRQLISGGKNGKQLMAADFISATGADGVDIISLPDGLTCVGRMKDGSSLTYEMEVGEEAMHLATYAASPVEGGIIEIRKGRADGELLGKFDVGFTAEWTSFQPYHANLNQPISGRQVLTLVFKARPQPPVAQTKDFAFWFAEVGTEDTTIWAQFKGVDPNKELVEINVRQSVFYPDQTGRNYITVKGFTLEQAAAPWAPPTAEQIALIGPLGRKVGSSKTIRSDIQPASGSHWAKPATSWTTSTTSAQRLNSLWRRVGRVRPWGIMSFGTTTFTTVAKPLSSGVWEAFSQSLREMKSTTSESTTTTAVVRRPASKCTVPWTS